MKIKIRDLPSKIVNNKTRYYCEIKCPKCEKLRTTRLDTFKTCSTTFCRSCLNSLRPKKDKEDLFNQQNYYHSLKGKASNIYTAQLQKCKERSYSLPTYTREELIMYLLNNSQYIDLFNKWEKANFDKNLAPSVDRIDDYKSYSFNNIQLGTWQFNNDNFSKNTISGKTTKVCKAVDQLDLNGNFIKRFHSQQAAMRDTNVPSNKISAICVGKPVKKGNRYSTPRTAGGFKWRYSTVPNTKQENKL